MNHFPASFPTFFPMSKESPAEKALNLIRRRLCDPTFVFRPLSVSSERNYSKLKFIVSNSITEGCNSSILLLGPHGSGKADVLDLVAGDLLDEYPDSVTVASFHENSQFIIAKLRECGLAHKMSLMNFTWLHGQEL